MAGRGWGAGGFGDAQGLGRGLLGPEVSGRGIGEIAGEKRRSGGPLDAAAIGAFGPDQSGGGSALRVIARKGVGGEGPTESEARRGGAIGNGLEPVGPFGQRFRQTGQGPQRPAAVGYSPRPEQPPARHDGRP